MHRNINHLCDLMGLNQYQSGKLKMHYDRYDFAHLQQRGVICTICNAWFVAVFRQGVFWGARRFNW